MKLDHYLLKPWDPPDRNLYPVLDDLLDQWSASYRPPFEGIRVIGTRWSPRCYEVREFLARNQIPYQWLDIESAEANGDPRVRSATGRLRFRSSSWRTAPRWPIRASANWRTASACERARRPSSSTW